MQPLALGQSSAETDYSTKYLPRLTAETLERHDGLEAARKNDPNFVHNGIRTEAAQKLQRTRAETGSYPTTSEDLASTHLYLPPEPSNTPPFERFLQPGICDAVFPLLRKTAVEAVGIPYASFESVDARMKALENVAQVAAGFKRKCKLPTPVNASAHNKAAKH